MDAAGGRGRWASSGWWRCDKYDRVRDEQCVVSKLLSTFGGAHCERDRRSENYRLRAEHCLRTTPAVGPQNYNASVVLVVDDIEHPVCRCENISRNANKHAHTDCSNINMYANDSSLGVVGRSFVRTTAKSSS